MNWVPFPKFQFMTLHSADLPQ